MTQSSSRPRPEDAENDITAAYNLLAEFGEVIADAMVQGSTHLKEDFPIGCNSYSNTHWTDSARFDEGDHVEGDVILEKSETISLEAPAWKVRAFVEDVGDFGGDDVDVTVEIEESRSWSGGGIQYNQFGDMVPTGEPPEDPERFTHTGNVTVQADVTHLIANR